VATPTLAQLMDAMADQIRGVVDDVTDVTVQVEPRWVTNPTPPCIDIYPYDPSTDEDLRAFQDVMGEPVFTVRARVDMSDSTAGQDLLLAFMDDTDPLSIAAALAEGDLDGRATTVYVRSRSGYVRTLDGGDHLGCVWQVVVTRAIS
jgi:hypothetical protein